MNKAMEKDSEAVVSDLEAVVRELVGQLEAKGDPERRAKSVTYFPTSMRVIGVSNPELYRLIRQLKKGYPGWADREWISFCLALARTGIFECRGIALELIGRSIPLLHALNRDELTVLGEGLDNWASVDHYAVGVYGVLWRLGTVRDRDIEELLGSPDPWKRRIAVVSTVALNLKSRGGTGDTARTIQVCRMVVDDRHDMIQKALSWALRELSKRDPEAVSGFIDQHRERLAGRVIREVSHKLQYGTKN